VINKLKLIELENTILLLNNQKALLTSRLHLAKLDGTCNDKIEHEFAKDMSKLGAEIAEAEYEIAKLRVRL
jgi:hypothetical protein